MTSSSSVVVCLFLAGLSVVWGASGPQGPPGGPPGGPAGGPPVGPGWQRPPPGPATRYPPTGLPHGIPCRYCVYTTPKPMLTQGKCTLVESTRYVYHSNSSMCCKSVRPVTVTSCVGACASGVTAVVVPSGAQSAPLEVLNANPACGATGVTLDQVDFLCNHPRYCDYVKRVSMHVRRPTACGCQRCGGN